MSRKKMQSLGHIFLKKPLDNHKLFLYYVYYVSNIRKYLIGGPMNKFSMVVLGLFLLFGNIWAQGLTITCPNGGEEWVVGNKYPIHWDWTGSITSVRLDYSTDGGTNWMLIASSSQNDGDYLWTIPNTVSASCFVKCSDYSHPEINDLSDGSFSIIRPSIDIKKPDGGEVLRVGEYYPIHWDWTGQFNTVKIEYSTDGGSSWSIIIASTQNDGEHYWQIPNFPSLNCRVKITNTGDPDCFNISDNDFIIANNTISVIKPDGGELYTTGQTYPIYWDWTGSFSSVKIDYSTDGGSTWNSVVTSTTNDGSHKWTIPNTPSNNCRMKITNTADPNCFDISDNDFTILSTGLQLKCPDGGENYVVGDLCSVHWDWLGIINSVRLEYSTDGGTTWNTIINSTTNDGDYVWTIPNIPSNQCRVKVTNLNDPNCWDISSTDFTVERPSFSIFDPDSGKSLVAGEVYPIHWNWRGTTGNVKLELWYKVATGVEWWTIISNTANDGSHYFTIPYFISDSCGIKITSNDDANCYALSQVFKIVRPTIEVVYPNGGENLIEGEDMEIIWNWNSNFSTVMLQYSIDEGMNWQTITTSTSNDGSYHWIIPSGVWTTCLIKVINTADIDCYDVSDASFNIINATIFVRRPASGDTFYIERNHPIYWNWTGNFSTAQIRYSTDGGSSWGSVTPSTPNSGYYIWECDTVVSNNARVMVINNQNTGSFDQSDQFVIADTSSLTESLRVLAPVSGDTFAVGGKCCITWHSVDFASPNQVSLYYSIDGGPWIGITTVSNTQHKYEWIVPNYVTNNCRILVEDVNGTASDVSDNFSIVLQEIKIVSPTAIKEWVVGRKYFILWNWTGGFGNAVIDYSYNGGSDWVNIASPTTNDGEYEWTIPNSPSTQCLIRIRNFENLNVVVKSDTFTIKPQTINISYPIASDSFIAGRKYYITWDYTGVFSSVNIEYSIDGGANWIPIATSVANNQYYQWTVPNTPSDITVVRVINSTNLDVFGLSDTFSIVPQGITVTSPVLNDEWIVGRKYYITWWYTGVFPNVKIDYSYDNGSSWNTIKESASNTSRYYEWTIPNTPSDTCLVRVLNHDNLAVCDTSEVFRIPLQTIDITSPKTDDNLISGKKYYITWKWTGTFSHVDIEYSVDNGNNWSYIQTNVTNNGSYEWTIPTANSDSCLVKLTNPQNPGVHNMSEMFSILPQEITITSPVSSDTLIAGRKYYLTWRTKGSFSNADMWYSLDGGQNWTVIATNITNNGRYEWTLPEAPSDLAGIKIGNSAQPSVFATSDTFIISPPIVDITSPALGNLWFSDRKYYITWTCLGVIQQVNLFYSLNGGSDWDQIVVNQQNQGNYEWTIPTGIESQDCRVKLESSANSLISYMSDSFAIATVGIEESSIKQLPKAFALQGFLPNPFEKRGNIKLAVPTNSVIKLTVYDACGRLVNKVFEGNIVPGYHSFEFNGKNTYGKDLPGGAYFLKFEARNKKEKIYDCTVKILKI